MSDPETLFAESERLFAELDNTVSATRGFIHLVSRYMMAKEYDDCDTVDQSHEDGIPFLALLVADQLQRAYCDYAESRDLAPAQPETPAPAQAGTEAA
ncbi:MAG TPA: hypothetical protein PKI20_19905 [Verrucomicrobiota bacterium]|mgnify:CR=1 FL=1|jgi:hypothetical protein|nr:hypothetical protein [Verrucomicrobiota bacterium]HQL80043.1 hypothetical protein [Verrucomicrobiota bacterium]